MKVKAILDSYSEDHHTLPHFKISLICIAPANTDQGRELRKEIFEILSKHCSERKPLTVDLSIESELK